MKNPIQTMLSRRCLSGRWNLSVETLKRREKAGILPFLKLGRGVRYRLADIERIGRVIGAMSAAFTMSGRMSR